MENPAGESADGVLRLGFERRLTLQFRGSVVTSDVGLLAYCELDDALGLSLMAGGMLADTRTGRNGRHALVALLRQSVFGRLAGYEDVNDAERLRYDPAMRGIVGGKAASGVAASPSEMGRFETRWLTAERNIAALADVSGQWITPPHRSALPCLLSPIRNHILTQYANTFFNSLVEWVQEKAGLSRSHGGLNRRTIAPTGLGIFGISV